MKPEEPKPANHVIVMCEPETSPGAQPLDAPLSASGRAAARRAADEMYGAGHHPGPLLVSATTAGRETAEILAQTVHIEPADIYVSSNLHGASTDVLEVEIRALAKEFTLVTLVAYNPGVTELAQILERDPTIPELQPGQWRYLRWPPPF